MSTIPTDWPRSPARNVGYVIVGALAAIMMLAVSWYGLQITIERLIAVVTAAFPTEMNDPGITFLSQIITYFTAIALGGILLWVYVQSQRPQRR